MGGLQEEVGGGGGGGGGGGWGGGYVVTGTQKYSTDWSILLIRLDAQGNDRWSRMIEHVNDYDEYGLAVTRTVDGGYALAGRYSNYPYYSAIVVKVDSVGNIEWARRFASYRCNDIIQTGDGGYLVACDDIGLLKLDSLGNFQWAKGLPMLDLYRVVPTADGGCAIAGRFYAAVDNELYVARLDSAGNVLWADTLPGTMAFDPPGVGLVATDDGGFAVTARYLHPQRGNEFYVVKLDSAGNVQWARLIGGTAGDYPTDIAQAPDGGYVLTGYTYSFGAGGADVYVVKLDRSGNLLWTRTIGTIDAEYAYSVLISRDGGVVVAGYYDPNSGNAGGYIVKLDSSGNLNTALCPGDQVSSGGILDSLTVVSAPAPVPVDTVFPIFTGAASYGYPVSSSVCGVLCGSTTELWVEACSSYTSPSGKYTWTTSGTYYDTLPDMNGCDSVFIIHLTITDTVHRVLSVSACERYTSPSGQHTWTVSGTYYDTLAGVSGCDTILTIHLTIFQVDTGVIQSGDTLMAVADSATYQWVSCDYGYSLIAGATEQYFVPEVTGSYAVIVMQDSCTDTSACYFVAVPGTGLADHGYSGAIAVRATNTGWMLQFAEVQEYVKVVVRTVTGQVVDEVARRFVRTLYVGKDGKPSGVYVLEVIGVDGRLGVFRVVW